MICDKCGEEIIKKKGGISTGYGIDKKGNKSCYACCGESDRQWMMDKGKIVLYLVRNEVTKDYEITNWPDSLVFKVWSMKEGRHNWADTRCDVWFKFKGFFWHGTQYGNSSQLCYCKKTKERY